MSFGEGGCSFAPGVGLFFGLSWREFQAGCIGPEHLEVVELAGCVDEDVDDHLVEIQEHPGAFYLIAGQIPAQAPCLFHREVELAGHRQGVACIASAGDDEVVSDRQGNRDIEDGDVLGLVLVEEIGDVESQFSCFDGGGLQKNGVRRDAVLHNVSQCAENIQRRARKSNFFFSLSSFFLRLVGVLLE